ncbi:tRNA pseudouridine(55) synthase TruB [Desulfallas thermosapovorans]|uniref:tRNA pseudouridine synthase B n=1 Tax=Desulfallas thermosapovorans DSM 6562 TaxID=1121431 RepID=A0A5S4ZYA1_9FIRM|nr:tRNA pseudouridine(55) synthase TruB [Desulfallas thermosapovorans]TYO97888.1 tRNA pseudouridine synthase B [Desulfallas thermosapovorans DSM 6562]
MDGIINILKPPGMTSHDVVSFVRRTTGQKKAGHTGTLDPGAAGVLPVCLGKATKIIQYLPGNKCYRAEVTFGKSTNTQDSFGEVITDRGAEGIEVGDIKQALASFTGWIEQVPPMTSAIKYKGKKLYELARAGIDVERKPRSVYIYDIALVAFHHHPVYPSAIFHLHCSAGTYVRTICHDLGQKLGCGAFMSFLLRTRAGMFVLDDAVTLEQLSELAGRDIKTLMVSMGKALEHLPAVAIEGAQVKAVSCGNCIKRPTFALAQKLTAGQLVRLESAGRLIALAVVKEPPGTGEQYMLQPVKVLA